jgi:hypothetical protein
MAEPKEPASLKERVEWELLKRGIAQAADSALDNLEVALFGKEGVPKETSLDALSRVRAHMQLPEPPTTPAIDALEQTRAQLKTLKEQLGRGDSPEAAPEVTPTPPSAAPEDPLAKARAQLEAIKKARSQPAVPVKKTL